MEAKVVPLGLPRFHRDKLLAQVGQNKAPAETEALDVVPLREAS